MKRQIAPYIFMITMVLALAACTTMQANPNAEIADAQASLLKATNALADRHDAQLIADAQYQESKAWVAEATGFLKDARAPGISAFDALFLVRQAEDRIDKISKVNGGVK